ncbi:MAG: hypothetical protein ACKVTZ_11035 [Bacteroidia bacterium]
MKLLQYLLFLTTFTLFLVTGKQVYAGVPNTPPAKQMLQKASKALNATPLSLEKEQNKPFWKVLKRSMFTKFFFIGAIFLAATIVLLWLSKTSPSLWVAGILCGIATSAFMLLWIVEVLTNRPLW